MFRIEPPWRDLRQFALVRSHSVFTINIEYFTDRRLFRWRRGSGFTRAAEAAGQRVPDAGDALLADAFNIGEPAVVRHRLEFFERAYTQVGL